MAKIKLPKNIIIPNGASPEFHEVEIVAILSSHFENITFLIPRDTYKSKTPDVVMD